MEEETLSRSDGPDLLSPPHVLAALMELFAGDKQQALSQQDQMIAHITACHQCRTAVMVLLSYAQEYDRRNDLSEEPTRELVTRFAHISRAIEMREAHEFERLAVYAETIHSEGQEQAAERYPALVAHLQICPECRSAVEATVAFLLEQHD